MPQQPDEEIVLQMQNVRAELEQDMHQARQAARELMDWKHYVRQYPLAVSAALVAVGYKLVPQLPHAGEELSSNEDSWSLSGLFEGGAKPQNKQLFESEAKAKSSPIVSSLTAIATTVATRALANYVTSLLNRSECNGTGTFEKSPATSSAN